MQGMFGKAQAKKPVFTQQMSLYAMEHLSGYETLFAFEKVRGVGCIFCLSGCPRLSPV